MTGNKRNRRTVIAATICILLIIALIIIGRYLSVPNRYNRVILPFSISDYEECIHEFPSDIVIGAVDNPERAEEEAEKIWIEIYGKSITTKQPYLTYFDEDSSVWMVTGSMPIESEGGVPYLLIKKETGEVLAVWHEK